MPGRACWPQLERTAANETKSNTKLFMTTPYVGANCTLKGACLGYSPITSPKLRAIAFQNPWRLSLAGALFLVTVPAKWRHVIESRRNLLKVHATQLEELLLFIEQRETAAPPIGRT